MTKESELLAAVDVYFDAIHECDTDKLNAVFHPQSSLFDADKGPIFVESIQSFSDDVGSRTSPASVGQARAADIIAIDFLSAISATVKIRIRAHQNVFVDHLAFVKGQKGWQIVSKVWHLESVVEG